MSARNFSETFGAGEVKRLPAGRYFFVRSATGVLDITTEGNPGSPVRLIGVTAGAKFGPVAEGEGWTFLVVSSATAQAVEIIISDDGNFEVASNVTVSGAVTVAESPSATINPCTNTTVNLGTSLDIAANLSRRRITICNLSSNTDSVFLRDTAGTGSAGMEIQPGMFVELRSTSAFRIRNNGATNVVVTMLEEV